VFHSDGKRRLGVFEKLFFKIATALRALLLFKIRLNDSGHRSIFACENKHDAQRAVSLWVKEEGTMRWIDSEVRAGDVFMDVGANIGIYTIAAAHRVGAEGKVYAFEPHKINALALMRNVQLSKLVDRVDLFFCPLSDKTSILRFNYASLASASSGSQFGHAKVAGKDKTFEPIASEMAMSVSADELIEQNIIRPPTLIKIDVDGNELTILRGMRKLLNGANKPHSVLVEINVGQETPINAFMQQCSYELVQRNLDRPGEIKRKDGVPLEKIEFNAIYRVAGSAARN
jgi:FkbM family methyltransferase